MRSTSRPVAGPRSSRAGRPGSRCAGRPTSRCAGRPRSSCATPTPTGPRPRQTPGPVGRRPVHRRPRWGAPTAGRTRPSRPSPTVARPGADDAVQHSPPDPPTARADPGRPPPLPEPRRHTPARTPGSDASQTRRAAEPRVRRGLRGAAPGSGGAARLRERRVRPPLGHGERPNPALGVGSVWRGRAGDVGRAGDRSRQVNARVTAARTAESTRWLRRVMPSSARSASASWSRVRSTPSDRSQRARSSSWSSL